MILLYILGGFLGMVLLYLLVIAVCALLVDPEKEYQKDNCVYRFLLNLTVNRLRGRYDLRPIYLIWIMPT